MSFLSEASRASSAWQVSGHLQWAIVDQTSRGVCECVCARARATLPTSDSMFPEYPEMIQNNDLGSVQFTDVLPTEVPIHLLARQTASQVL